MTRTDAMSRQAALRLDAPFPANQDQKRPFGGSQRMVRSRSITLSGGAILASWFASILLHVIVFLVMLFLVFPFAARPKSDSVVMTDVEFVGQVDAAWSPMMTPEPVTPVEAESFEPVRVAVEPQVPLAEMTRTKKPELSILGIGAGGGEFADYGLSIGSGVGTSTEFFGVGGSAQGVRSVVYVVDVSGSMRYTFGYVQDELRRSISALRRSQKFHVIFFSSGPPVEKPPRRLVSAIEAHKENFFEFLDQMRVGGGTVPGPAMKRALELQPDVIYFLTDGIFSPELIPELASWNEGRRTRVFTIGYLSEEGREILELIAREHRGEFKFVSEYDLP